MASTACPFSFTADLYLAAVARGIGIEHVAGLIVGAQGRGQIRDVVLVALPGCLELDRIRICKLLHTNTLEV